MSPLAKKLLNTICFVNYENQPYFTLAVDIRHSLEIFLTEKHESHDFGGGGGGGQGVDIYGRGAA